MDMGTTYRSSVEWVVRFAYASGATSIVANPFFIAYSAWRPATRKTGPPSVRARPADSDTLLFRRFARRIK
jgi:hypothetical protein